MTNRQERPHGGNPTSPLASMLRHWVTTLLLALLGLALGLGAAWVSPVTYRAETRLAVAPDSDNAYSIAGFPLAARDLAANYARWVQNNATSGEWATDGVTKLQATPIPESAVIRIEAEAPGEDAAREGAQHAADKLVAMATETQRTRNPNTAYKAFENLAPEVARAQAAVSDAESAVGRATGSDASTATRRRAQARLDKARVDLAKLQLKQDANSELYRRLYADTMGITQLRVLSPAASVGDDRRSRLQRYGMLGLGAGLGLGLIASTLRDRRRARRDDERGTDPTFDREPHVHHGDVHPTDTTEPTDPGAPGATATRP